MARKKKKKKMSSRDIRNFTNKKISKVRMLLDSGKELESIVYLFHILAWLIEEKYEIKKTPSDTIKEFFTSLVMKQTIPADNVHPFVSMFEELLYSHHELPGNTLAKFQEKWATLYKDVIGDTPPSI